MITITKVKNKPDMIEISSDDEIMIESKTLLALNNLLNNSDLAQVLKMAILIKPPLNIIYNGDVPHTNETLQVYLGIESQSHYFRLIKRLVIAGVLHKVKDRINGEVRISYMFNPYLCKRKELCEHKAFKIFEKFVELNKITI